jgi:hypothetical protein
MSFDEQDLRDDDEDEIDPEDYPTLVAVARFARALERVDWFTLLGEPLSEDEEDEALDYLQALGFPDAMVVPVADWEEAESCAANPDWNSAWWEAEEQSRAALLSDALEILDEEEVTAALNDVTGRALELAGSAAAAAAARAGVDDEALIRAAAGAAVQGAYQAALVYLAGAGLDEDEDEHPFAIKFRLFEAGRWPLGVVGASFNIF